MRMIAARLEGYDCHVSIIEGAIDIEGIRLFTAQPDMADRSIAFVGDASTIISDARFAEGVIIVHGHDMIVVMNQRIDTVLNDVLSLIDTLSAWETSMWEASGYSDALQRIADLSVGVLAGTLLMTDRYGFIVAKSTMYVPTVGLWGLAHLPDPDPMIVSAWNDELLGSDVLPARYLYQPCIDEEGVQQDDWSTVPMILHDDRGERFIGAQIESEGEPTLWMGEMQYARPLDQADVQLLQIMERVVQAVVDSSCEISMPGNALLRNLLEGAQGQSERFDATVEQMQMTRPFIAIALRNLSGPMENRKTALSRMAAQTGISLLSAVFGEDTVVLLSAEKAASFLEKLSSQILTEYHSFGVSMPFYRGDDLLARYRQAVFAIEESGEVPGVHRVEDHAYEYALSLLDEDGRGLEIHHPILDRLADIDARNGSNLYETLFYYLACERNETRSAQAMHIHRNTLIGRLRRLETVIGDINLSDFDTRAFILLSYLGRGMHV